MVALHLLERARVVRVRFSGRRRPERACLARQYCTHARIVRGQKSHDFFTTLVAEGLATANHTAHRGTILYHLHGKRLYRAIGEPDDRHRQPVTLARAIERLMVVDGVLAEPETAWLATPYEKAEHFTPVTSLPLETLPARRTGEQGGRRRVFPDALPIGWARDDRLYVFLYPGVRAFRPHTTVARAELPQAAILAHVDLPAITQRPSQS